MAISALVLVARSQDLPPGVVLLAHIKTQVGAELARLPNYTCLETASRFHTAAADGPRKETLLKPLDTVRLEIVYSDGHEWYGAQGDRDMAESDPVRFIGSGTAANGIFAMMRSNIFLADGTRFTYQGEAPLDGRQTVRYDFRRPRDSGGLDISVAGGSGAVGLAGSFWVDPQSLDLIRIDAHADDVPPFLPLRLMNLDISYARTRVGDVEVLLAQDANLHMSSAINGESFNHYEYTHCRAYSAQSFIRFSEDAAAAPSSRTVAAKPEPIPALLLVTLRLATPVTEKDAVGSRIEAKVVGDVVYKGKVAIADGSVVHGRLRRMERYQDGTAFIVGLEFTDVESKGEPRRFYADLLRMDPRPEVSAARSEPVLVKSGSGYEGATQTVTLAELAGVASFFVRGKTFVLPAGFQTVWRTRGILR